MRALRFSITHRQVSNSCRVHVLIGGTAWNPLSHFFTSSSFDSFRSLGAVDCLLPLELRRGERVPLDVRTARQRGTCTLDVKFHP